VLKLIPYIKITVEKKYKISALNLINTSNLTFKKLFLNEKEDLILIISFFKLNAYKELFQKNQIDATFDTQKGVFGIFYDNKHRLGVAIGILFLILSLSISSKYVWRIEIEGNNTTTDQEILAGLEKVGFSLGSYIPKINYDDLHNKFLMNVDSISWISVNIKGNVATVLVREKLAENAKDDFKYTNIVANSDGHIALISVIDGKKHISIGDVVKKGDLLISGIINSQSQGVRYVNAQGSVFAYVNREIYIEIPYKTTKKVYTKDVYYEKTPIFFSKVIKLYKNNNKNDRLYDIIEKTEYLYLFDSIKLPIRFLTKEYREYTYSDIIYSKDDATSIAYKELEQKIQDIKKISEIITQDVQISYDESGAYLTCKLYCLEDIASPLELYVNQK